MASAFSIAMLLVLTSSDGAVLGACLALAMATVLFIFYIQPDASDLAPHRTKLDQLMGQRDTICANRSGLRSQRRRSGGLEKSASIVFATAVDTGGDVYADGRSCASGNAARHREE